MTCPKCRPCDDRDLDHLRTQIDYTAIAPLGLCESGMSAPVAERIE